jgi:EvpB/VC_A0108, tail sheath N-terminal domain/Type VI secretion system, VipA, VC_A0107 or Hcp2
MSNSDKPNRGVRLDAAFGDGPSAAQSPRTPTDVAFRMMIVGDFGGSAEGRITDASGEDFASLLAAFGAAVELEAPNRLGSVPPALAVRLPIAVVRDLDPRTIPAKVPEIVEAERLVKASRDGRAVADPGSRAANPSFDHITAALQSPFSVSSLHSPAAPGVDSDDDSIDRLLDMVDTPASASQPDFGKAAVSAFVSSLGATRRLATSAPQAGAQLLAQQAQDISSHPRWLAIEAAWRSLRLIFAARGARHATHIEICDAPRARLAEVMESRSFRESAAGTQLKAVVVLGAFSRSVKDLNDLDRLARVAETLEAPTIVSLDKDFFGAPPLSVATMDNPAALLEGRGYEGWRGLRGREESRALFACWNDFVLRSDATCAPMLWGEPGAIVAAQILRSLAQTGWPTEISGAATALSGLDVAEVETRGGRRTAIPLRALIDLDVARDLGREGVICLACRADRDQAWLVRTSSVCAHSVTPEADRKAVENFDSLPFRFVSVYFANLVRGYAETLSAPGLDDAQTAASIEGLLNDALIATGPGGAARAKLAAHEAEDDDGARRFEVTIRLGQSVMSGLEFSFELAF